MHNRSENKCDALYNSICFFFLHEASHYFAIFILIFFSLPWKLSQTTAGSNNNKNIFLAILSVRYK